MRRCLLLSSMLLMVETMSAAGFLLPLDGRQELNVTIEARGAVITGVCVVKTGDEGSRGAIVNEFGVHALDFTVSADRRKVKLLNVMPMLNRWYVKRVLRKDLRLLFGAKEPGRQAGGRIVSAGADGAVTLENSKFKLKYCFMPLNTVDDTENRDEATE